MEILSEVTLNDTQEKTLILRSRIPIQNHACYETVAKYYSAHCYSIAQVFNLNFPRSLLSAPNPRERVDHSQPFDVILGRKPRYSHFVE